MNLVRWMSVRTVPGAFSLERMVEAGENFRVLSLEALVRVKLTAFRDKDRVHLRDLIDIGLVDETWAARFPDVLSERLRSILESPEN